MKKGINQTFGSILQAFDWFSLDMTFKINSQARFTTWRGIFLSIFVIVLMGYYAQIKFDLLTSYGDTNFQEIELLRDEIPKFEGGSL